MLQDKLSVGSLVIPTPLGTEYLRDGPVGRWFKSNHLDFSVGVKAGAKP